MADLSRREFVINGAKWAALASVPFVFRVNPLAALTTPTETSTLTDYLNHFGITEKLIRDVMASAMGRGGDYCDLYFQHALSTTMVLDDDVVNRAYTNIDFGVGIRVIEGDQTGYSFTEEITPDAMHKAARTAANIAGQSKNMPPVGFEVPTLPSYYPIKTLWEDVKVDQRIPYLQKLNTIAKESDSRVIKSTVYFSDSSSYMLMANSDGRIVYDYQPMCRVGVSCTAEQDGRRERGGHNISGRYGLEHFTPERVKHLATESVRRTVQLFEAVKPAPGEMEVVMAAGSSGILLHEAIGHGMEADFNRKGISIFADKIDKKVAEPFVSIVDDGTNPGYRGSINVDDEGNQTEQTYLVRDGILRSYLHDRISAQHYNVKPTGSGRRQSFRYPVIPRMRNTYMLPGPHKKDEIISSVKKGLYAESFSNGEVRIGAGDFTFYVLSGFLIEDGKLTTPVKDINLIGNGPDVLSKVTMVADDLELSESGWTCGKGGQGVPVSMGLPTVKVSAITVGGVSS